MSDNVTECVQYSRSDLEELLEKLEPFDPFVEILNKYVEDTGIQQKELAKQIYVQPSAVSQWFNKRRFPSLDKVRLLANALALPASKKHILIKSWFTTSVIREQRQFLRESLEQNDLQSASEIVNIFNLRRVVQGGTNELEIIPVFELVEENESQPYSMDAG